MSVSEISSRPSGDFAPANEAGERTAEPQVFSRVFTTPAGMPWEQARAAQLEARHGSPLPIAELIFRLKRLTPWSLGQPSRFAVFYVRLQEYERPFERTLEVDGQPVRVAFGAKARSTPQARHAVLVGLAAAASVLVMVAGVSLALSAKAEALARLEAAEQRAMGKARIAQAALRKAQSADLLRRQIGASKPVGEVVSDFAWVASARTEEARIVAVHWDHGLVAVEARGENAPLTVNNGSLQRTAEPIRKGVWLWAATPPGRDPLRGVK